LEPQEAKKNSAFQRRDELAGPTLRFGFFLGLGFGFAFAFGLPRGRAGLGVRLFAGRDVASVASPLAVEPVQLGGSLAGKDSSEDSSMTSSGASRGGGDERTVICGPGWPGTSPPGNRWPPAKPL